MERKRPVYEGPDSTKTAKKRRSIEVLFQGKEHEQGKYSDSQADWKVLVR